VVQAVELLRVPIVFRGTDGSELHAPMVEARVGGVRTLIVLDTGSDTHLLNKELVDEIGLAAEPGETGTDHAGTEMPSWNLGTVPIEIAGVGLSLTDVVSIPAPPPFPGWGVGGILSPQRLRHSAQAVVDMVYGELVLLEGTESAAHAWALDRHLRLRALILDRVGSDHTVLVSAAISPHPPVPTLVDTGGRDTEFDRSALPGVGGSGAERLGGSVSGADVVGERAGAAVLLAGGAEIPVPNLALRDGMDPPGIIGMDVLRGTVLVVGDDPDGRVLWLLPADRVAPDAPEQR